MDVLKDHLLPEVRAKLDVSDAERIAFCREDRWIAYPQAKQILDELDQLVAYPVTQRPPCRLIVARGDNGKSAIVRQFALRHPMLVTEQGTPDLPVAVINMPGSPDPSQMWSAILTAELIVHRPSDSASAKRAQVVSILRHNRVRVLVVDEFNNITNAGKRAADLLSSLRVLSSELNISIVAAGTQAAIHALSFDPQMRSRFQPLPVRLWTMDKAYRNFLYTYERLLPLAHPSGLAEPELMPLVFSMAGPAIGGTVALLKEAAVLAIRSGQERITAEVLHGVQANSKDNWDAIAKAV
ncbi:TniB family NTP-binding protein [Xanthomonas vasicola]|uniref:TniB family NTP-binding protein n=1 Tax=Xanthomonas vasicola TaxID=56459 RepID=UPI00034B45C9|nr:TniB family NTP-binding protein [Xanthomonas vasicola]AZR35204.1 transposase [Xanthomonas vasicola]AZR36463.1 transposase [Xanthomonas vasicola]KFA35855.1 TniB [Xanthomonas vasicola pv. vasculorum NCPPB 206]KGR53807.1 TniB [Xanthomonas vasicola]KGR57691.1 TniB [Xanthomonas vasicola]